LAENSLDELVDVYLGDLVGDKIFDEFGEQFPLLVKIIDAAQNLSIQVHPNDEIAWERHNSFGKNEMWYVLDADENAFIIAGFYKKITEKEFRVAIRNNTIYDYLKKIPVKKGDAIHIPAGCIHAIGNGCLILEIQQPSNVTYRIYDYNRLDANGLPRELHTELAIDAIDFDNWNTDKLVLHIVPNKLENLVDCEYFTVNILEIDKKIEFDLIKINSFVLISLVEGEVSCEYTDGKLNVKNTETILIPADMNNIVLVPKSKKAKILQVFIKN
jgi:mannose-6-phosphate isomerase